MIDEQRIRARIRTIEDDERIHYKPALIQINAPLALIQVELTTEANTLRSVLGMPKLRYHGRPDELLMNGDITKSRSGS